MRDDYSGVGKVQARLDSEIPSARLVTVADVEPTEIEWLWPGRFALGKFSLISGNPGLGKSTLSLEIAGHVSNGSRWPVEGGLAPRGDTILLSAEDSIADTIRPRLDAIGADVSRIHVLTMIEARNEDGTQAQRMFSLEHDVELLGQALRLLPDCNLVIIDPISAYMGHVDSHKNSDVRGVLAPLTELAERYRVAIIGISHFNKSAGKAIYRTMGSQAFVAASRTAYGIVADEDEPDRSLFLPIKNNIAPRSAGLAYRVESPEGGSSFLSWEPEPVEHSIDDALYHDDEKSALDEAVEWLDQLLSEGRVATTEIQKLAKQAGHSWATVRRAKTKLRAEAKREGFGERIKHFWRLPIDAQHIDAQPSRQQMSTYGDVPDVTESQSRGSSSDLHRCSTVNGGVEPLCTGEPVERF